MRRERTLRPAGGRRRDHVPERLVPARAAERAGLPPPKVVPYPSFDRFPKEKPRLPHRTRHHADFGKLGVGRLGSVAAAHGRGQADDLAAPFQARACERTGHDEGQQGRRRDEDVRTGDEAGAELPAPLMKECVELLDLIRRQGGEPGQGRASMAVERRWKPPYAAAPFTELALLRRAVLVQSVRGVGHHRVHAARRLFVEPPKRLGMEQGDAAEMKRRPAGFLRRFGGRQREARKGRAAVPPPAFPHEQAGGVEGEAGLNRRPGNRSGLRAHPFADLHDAERNGGLAEYPQDGIAHPSRALPFPSPFHGGGV